MNTLMLLLLILLLPFLVFVVTKYASYGWYRGRDLAEKGGDPETSDPMKDANPRDF